jgi:glycosyltransferase involved in cell wall biosynthesis
MIAPVVEITSAETAAASAGSASVSVIVPSYNCGRFIAEAIDSILGQTVAPEQIVIVDDGSTDDTEQVVRRYTDPRIEYIKQQNGGVASARNAGLNAARCELVTFLDADDRWRPTFIETMQAFLAQEPTAACVFCNFVRFRHATGEMLPDQFQYYPELRRPTLLRHAPNAFGRIPKEMAFRALVACSEIPAYTQVMMFRRALIETTRFETSLVLGEDTNFALKAFMQGGVIFTDEVLAEVRRHDTNATLDHGEMAIHKLNGLKALAPHVTRSVDLVAYHDRLIKAHIDAALYQIKRGNVRAGLRTYRDGLQIPGSRMRKLKGSVRLALALPRGLAK